MKNINKIISILLVAVLLIGVLAGCSKFNEVQKTENKSQKEEQKTITITDMAQRKVEIPSNIEKVYCKSPEGTILMYTLAPDKLAGWNYQFTTNEKKYIPEKYKDLPILGGWFGKNNTGNIEEILKGAPDIIINMGRINDTEIDANNSLQEQIGIPIVMVKSETLDDLEDAYAFIGKIIGEEERAKELADYCKNTLNYALEKSENISEEDKVTVYYAQGQKGLNTEAPGSVRMEVIRLIGGKNAADISDDSSYGRSKVSLEQVLLWNPDIIITARESSDDNTKSFFQTIYENEDWKDINAVKNKKVYGIPQNPFGWFDRPPSVNRIIGIKWLGHVLYPKAYEYDIIEEVKEFYKTFYHYEISDEEAKEFLNMD
ncbi:ABC transporter substrate-binding protein [Maledivibacter halophilus]|uniref:Iron complex transport system substrate-binding protein n=1 Tax=Maledivibacter halophilus TaxID=36842 RepID=A0A1T5J5P9_9FIRM|nr:ABC transporter substrate-binding protein [Maledivibacter halophilus]SKC46729.1 iron complex transport system substrate-binding protein [Maledivibacter halophilus]